MEKNKIPKSRLRDINATIEFFIKWSMIVKIFMFFLAGIILLIMISKSNELEMETVLIYFLQAILLICCGFIGEATLKWKAYMLYTNLKSDD